MAEGKGKPVIDVDRKPPPAYYKPKYDYVSP
jgi:hypothetical protein